MASEQQRKENTTKEREYSEKDHKVPMLVSRFEELTEKTQGSEANVTYHATRDAAAAKHTSRKGTEHADKSGARRGYSIGKFEATPAAEKGTERGYQREESKAHRAPATKKKEGEKGGTFLEESERPLEEISEYRQKAQQSLIEALQAAEERYNKAKETTSATIQEAKVSAAHGVDTVKSYETHSGSQTPDTLKSGYQSTTQFISEKGTPIKDTALEKAQQGYFTTKDTMAESGRTALDYTKQIADYATQKAGDVKNSTISATQKAYGFAGEKAGEAKETARSVAGYLGEETVATGKGAASLTGKVAGVVKDSAVVAGWEAAHLTTEAAVGATKITAGVVKGAAEYVSKATDMVVGAGEKAMEFVENQAAVAKDVALSAGESAADYATRKRVEAQQNFQSKNSETAEGTKGGGMEADTKHSGGSITIKVQEGERAISQKNTGKSGEYNMGEWGKASHGTGNIQQGISDSAESMSEPATGVLDSVGKTIVEIAEHTKDLFIGPDDQTEEGETRRARRAS